MDFAIDRQPEKPRFNFRGLGSKITKNSDKLLK